MRMPGELFSFSGARSRRKLTKHLASKKTKVLVVNYFSLKSFFALPLHASLVPYAFFDALRPFVVALQWLLNVPRPENYKKFSWSIRRFWAEASNLPVSFVLLRFSYYFQPKLIQALRAFSALLPIKFHLSISMASTIHLHKIRLFVLILYASSIFSYIDVNRLSNNVFGKAKRGRGQLLRIVKSFKPSRLRTR